MGKTYRRDGGYRPKNGKGDFKKFKKSNKFKNWDEKPKHSLKPNNEPSIDEGESP